MDIATQIGPGTLVEISYTLYDEDGEVVDVASTEQPLVYVHGYGQIVPGLERGIEGMFAGQGREVKVASGDAYGDHDPDGVFQIAKADFPEADKVELEDEFIAEGSDGSEMPLRIIEILPDAFVVDANHPLAGVTLHYSVAVREVRGATDDEIEAAASEFDEAAHVHGDDCGHDHSHGHDHVHAPEAGSLVQLGKKPNQTN